MDAAERDSFIQLYFEMGLKYADITRTLAVYHHIIITERHLKRILKKLGLFRRKEYSNIVDVISFVEQQLQESGRLHGYRWMTQKCKVNGLKCTQEEIRIIIRMLDPEGSQQRKGRRLMRRSYISKGPNFLWHLDSYDKLKRFGFCINGCVDGFSRLIVWLNCYITSSDPRVIASYFMESVCSLEGCPQAVRGDLGTENVLVKQLQMFLRRTGDDNRAGELSYLAGPSTANQRIEYFWNFLRRECTDYWICLFRELEADGNFDGSFLDTSLMQYCFMHLVQKDLDSVTETWNSHKIRPVRNSRSPSGRPSVLYRLPEIYGTRDYICHLPDADIYVCKQECTFRKPLPCDKDMFEMCSIIMSEIDIAYPSVVNEALELYIVLRREARTFLGL